MSVFPLLDMLNSNTVESFEIITDNPRRPRFAASELSFNAGIPALYRITSTNRFLKKKTNASRWSSTPVSKIDESENDPINDDPVDYGYEEHKVGNTSPKIETFRCEKKISPTASLRKPTRKASLDFVPNLDNCHSTISSKECLKKPTRKASMDFVQPTVQLKKPMRKASIDLGTTIIEVDDDGQLCISSDDDDDEDSMLNHLLKKRPEIKAEQRESPLKFASPRKLTRKLSERMIDGLEMNQNLLVDVDETGGPTALFPHVSKRLPECYCPEPGSPSASTRSIDFVEMSKLDSSEVSMDDDSMLQRVSRRLPECFSPTGSAPATSIRKKELVEMSLWDSYNALDDDDTDSILHHLFKTRPELVKQMQEESSKSQSETSNDLGKNSSHDSCDGHEANKQRGGLSIDDSDSLLLQLFQDNPGQRNSAENKRRSSLSIKKPMRKATMDMLAYSIDETEEVSEEVPIDDPDSMIYQLFNSNPGLNMSAPCGIRSSLSMKQPRRKASMDTSACSIFENEEQAERMPMDSLKTEDSPSLQNGRRTNKSGTCDLRSSLSKKQPIRKPTMDLTDSSYSGHEEQAEQLTMDSMGSMGYDSYQSMFGKIDSVQSLSGCSFDGASNAANNIVNYKMQDDAKKEEVMDEYELILRRFNENSSEFCADTVPSSSPLVTKPIKGKADMTIVNGCNKEVVSKTLESLPDSSTSMMSLVRDAHKDDKIIRHKRHKSLTKVIGKLRNFLSTNNPQEAVQ